MPELDAERRERLATVLAEHTYDYPDSFCGCGKHFDRPWFEWQAHVADALAPLVAGWLADDTAVCTTCQHRGGDDQPAQHPGCAAALGRIRSAALREAAKDAEERGDIGKPDGGTEAWVWLRARADRIEGTR